MHRKRRTDDLAELDAVREEIRRADERAVEARQAAARSSARWPRIEQILDRAREIRERNHLADDLRVIFRGHG